MHYSCYIVFLSQSGFRIFNYFHFSGIGIDDMFVIMQCLYNLQSTQNNEVLDLHEQIGETLKHAGVAITVTSITDIFAFGIGAVTVSSTLSKIAHNVSLEFCNFGIFTKFCPTKVDLFW